MCSVCIAVAVVISGIGLVLKIDYSKQGLLVSDVNYLLVLFPLHRH